MYYISDSINLTKKSTIYRSIWKDAEKEWRSTYDVL